MDKQLLLGASMICAGLLTWNVATTHQLAIEIASFKTALLQRVERLEFWTERLANRVNALETERDN